MSLSWGHTHLILSVLLQAVALALACLSYDFVGTSMDDSSEDLGTIQVSSAFAAFTCWSRFTTYSFPEALKTFHNVETHFCCPQAFLSVDFQCRDNVSESKQTSRD